jgi:hypothetical protein
MGDREASVLTTYMLSKIKTALQNNTFKSSSYVVFPKLEHQVFFGCEVNSHTEIVHQWAQLLCRPNSQLLQGAS